MFVWLEWGRQDNDAEGNRVAKGSLTSFSCDLTQNGFATTTQYIVGQSGEQITAVDGAGNWLRSNVYAAGAPLATYDANGLHFNLSDALGTKRVQVNATGVVEETCQSLPFGDALSCTGTGADDNKLHFTAKERDQESGNDYFGARYLSSNAGRFLSPDPGPWLFTNPQGYNKYAYGLNNPLRYSDDSGETPQDRVDAAYRFAAENIPYALGGGHPGNKMEHCGMDCSGLVRAVLKADPDNTLNVNGTAAGEASQLQAGGQYSTNINDAQPGDAIFFSNSEGQIAHTGIVVSVKDGKLYFIDAPHKGAKVKRENPIYIKTKMFGDEKFAGVGRPIEPNLSNPNSNSSRVSGPSGNQNGGGFSNWLTRLFFNSSPPPPPPSSGSTIHLNLYQ